MNKTPVRFEYYILVIGSKKINLTSFKGVHPFQNQKNTESSLQLSTHPLEFTDRILRGHKKQTLGFPTQASIARASFQHPAIKKGGLLTVDGVG